PARFCLRNILRGFFGRAVRGKNAALMFDPKLGEQGVRMLHHVPIGFTAHQNNNEWLGHKVFSSGGFLYYPVFRMPLATPLMDKRTARFRSSRERPEARQALSRLIWK